MPTETIHVPTIAFAGRVLTPGDTFAPFPEIPGYEVTFDGILDGHVVVSDRLRTLTCPLDAIADA